MPWLITNSEVRLYGIYSQFQNKHSILCYIEAKAGMLQKHFFCLSSGILVRFHLKVACDGDLNAPGTGYLC